VWFVISWLALCLPDERDEALVLGGAAAVRLAQRGHQRAPSATDVRGKPSSVMASIVQPTSWSRRPARADAGVLAMECGVILGIDALGGRAGYGRAVTRDRTL
jgi:hypothetical protein